MVPEVAVRPFHAASLVTAVLLGALGWRRLGGLTCLTGGLQVSRVAPATS
jgi:hypothetical protein